MKVGTLQGWLFFTLGAEKVWTLHKSQKHINFSEPGESKCGLSNLLQTCQPEMKLENFLAKGDILSESEGGQTRSVGAEDGTALGWVLGRCD